MGILWIATLCIVLTLGDKQTFRFDILDEITWDEYNINKSDYGEINGRANSCIKSLFCVKWDDINGFSFTLQSTLPNIPTIPKSEPLLVNENQCHTGNDIKICFTYTYDNNFTMDISIYLQNKHETTSSSTHGYVRRRLPTKKKKGTKSSSKIKSGLIRAKSLFSFSKDKNKNYKPLADQEHDEISDAHLKQLNKKDASKKIDEIWTSLGQKLGGNLGMLYKQWWGTVKANTGKLHEFVQQYGDKIELGVDVALAVMTGGATFLNAAQTAGGMGLEKVGGMIIDKAVTKSWKKDKAFKIKKKKRKSAGTASAKKITRQMTGELAKTAAIGLVVGVVTFAAVSNPIGGGALGVALGIVGGKRLLKIIRVKAREKTKAQKLLDFAKNDKNIQLGINEIVLGKFIFPFDELSLEEKKKVLFMIYYLENPDKNAYIKKESQTEELLMESKIGSKWDMSKVNPKKVSFNNNNNNKNKNNNKNSNNAHLSYFDTLADGYDNQDIQSSYYNGYNEHNNYYSELTLIVMNTILLLAILCLLCGVFSIICMFIGYLIGQFTKTKPESKDFDISQYNNDESV